MFRASHIRATICLKVTFFLLASIFYNNFANLTQTKSAKFGYTQKADSSTPLDTQLPYEEKEKEADGLEEEVQKNFEFLLLMDLSAVVANPQLDNFCYEAPRSCGVATDIPIYIATRTLLI